MLVFPDELITQTPKHRHDGASAFHRSADTLGALAVAGAARRISG